jgi:excisionase family DNA binding protein
MNESLLKPAEVMELLSVSRGWLYKAAAEGTIPSLRLGGAGGPLRFARSDVEAWLEQARQGWRPGDTPTATLHRAQDTTASS